MRETAQRATDKKRPCRRINRSSAKRTRGTFPPSAKGFIFSRECSPVLCNHGRTMSKPSLSSSGRFRESRFFGKGRTAKQLRYPNEESDLRRTQTPDENRPDTTHSLSRPRRPYRKRNDPTSFPELKITPAGIRIGRGEIVKTELVIRTLYFPPVYSRIPHSTPPDLPLRHRKDLRYLFSRPLPASSPLPIRSLSPDEQAQTGRDKFFRPRINVPAFSTTQQATDSHRTKRNLPSPAATPADNGAHRCREKADRTTP